MNNTLIHRNQSLTNFIKTFIHYNNVAGLAISAFDASGKTIYENFFGYSNISIQKKINEHTIFGIASITKSFTCFLILKLQEEGKLNINDPISKYIPEFTIKNQGTEILIKHLMTHSAGFFPMKRLTMKQTAGKLKINQKSSGDFAYNQLIETEGLKTVLFQLEKEQSFTGFPGQYFSYCNDGYGLLTMLIKRVSNYNSYAEYLNDCILTPLKMTRSSCEFLKSNTDLNSSNLYHLKEKQLVEYPDNLDNIFTLNGVGSMKSTISDMKKYISCILNLGKTNTNDTIFKTEIVKDLCSSHQDHTYISTYGYGVVIKKFNDIEIFEHSGALSGVSAEMLWSFKQGLGIIVLCNTSDISSTTIAETTYNFLTNGTLVNFRYNFDKKNWTSSTIEDACGFYKSNEGKCICITYINGKLILNIDGKINYAQMISETVAMVSSTFSDTFLELIKNSINKTYAIRYGTRILPKIYDHKSFSKSYKKDFSFKFSLF